MLKRSFTALALTALLAGCSNTAAQQARTAAPGDVVATVGSSGRASGPHLHFAAQRDGQAIDPSALLEPGTAAVAAASAAPGDGAQHASAIQVPPTPGRYPDRARSDGTRETS